MPRIFISCVTAEFGACRVELAKHFRGVDECDVKIQEDFCQVPEDTIQKLDAYIQRCDAVVHIIGEGAGAIAERNAVIAFLQSEPSFTEKMKELGDFEGSQISYTHWEAILAAYRGKPLFVYQAAMPILDGHPTKACGFEKDWPAFAPQKADAELVRQHCARLEHFPTRRYASKFNSRAELYLKFGADLHAILGPRAYASIALRERFGAHKVDELREVLRTMGDPLLKEGYVLATFVQISSDIPTAVAHDRRLDLALVNTLAERQSPHDLLGFVKACEIRSKVLGLEDLSHKLREWFSEALSCFNACRRVAYANTPNPPDEDLTELAVMGRCGEALNFLRPDSFPKPTLEIAWRRDAAVPDKQIVPEAYLRWGRYLKQVSLGNPAVVPKEEGPTRIVQRLRSLRQVQYVRFDRLDIFVSREDLGRPWEYVAGHKPDDEDAQLLPWPAVVRLLGRREVFSETKVPPDPISRRQLACRCGDRDTFMAEVRERGAFFAALDESEDSAVVIGRAAIRASLGFWIRTALHAEQIEDCLNTLEGMAFAAVPLCVFQRKLDSPKDSLWRKITVLYDHPEWPTFEFSEEQFSLSDLEAMNRALT